MRIGTWNLEGRWTTAHADLLASLGCDVLLLTEVRHDVALPGTVLHRSEGEMAPGRSWAAVAAPSPVPVPDPHGATAAAVVDGVLCCASVLPWRACGAEAPWVGRDTAERTAEAVAAVEQIGPRIWGGDWNHALIGPEAAGSLGGRAAITAAVERLGLVVPTAAEPHVVEGLRTIDHVAVPAPAEVVGVEHHRAARDGRRLSDHDAYVVEVAHL